MTEINSSARPEFLHEHYSFLGVPQNAESEEIRQAYRKFLLIHHPDKNGGSPKSVQMTQKINASWEVLQDETKRLAYDYDIRSCPELYGLNQPNPPNQFPIYRPKTKKKRAKQQRDEASRAKQKSYARSQTRAAKTHSPEDYKYEAKSAPKPEPHPNNTFQPKPKMGEKWMKPSGFFEAQNEGNMSRQGPESSSSQPCDGSNDSRPPTAQLTTIPPWKPYVGNVKPTNFPLPINTEDRVETNIVNGLFVTETLHSGYHFSDEIYFQDQAKEVEHLDIKTYSQTSASLRAEENHAVNSSS